MKARFLDGITSITAEEWNRVAGDEYPFLRHEFLLALEESGSASPSRGWQPQHLVVEEGGRLLAVLPLYIKQHSMGEYVFDQSWARAYQRHGLNYYPKLLGAIPFTPASGPRLAFLECDTGQLMNVVCNALQQHCAKINASGWHVLFPEEDSLPLWQQTASQTRLGCQFHWFNEGYASFDDFLGTFSSRKRKEVKRERRRVAEQGVQIKRLSGDDITAEDWQAFFRFYQLTNLKYNGHGGYLTADFFMRLYAVMRSHLLLVMAFDENSEPVAGALNMIGANTLYGRYWGCEREIDQLHFELCYYQGIDYCIEHGLQRFDPGAQGEHKIARGFRPIMTFSRHWLADRQFNQAIGDFLTEESTAVIQYCQAASAGLPFRRNSTDQECLSMPFCSSGQAAFR